VIGRRFVLGAVAATLLGCSSGPPPQAAESPSPTAPPAPSPATPTDPYVVVLGTAQDAGRPQAACRKDCCRAVRADPSLRRRVASLGIVDPRSGSRWLVEATPDLPAQLQALAEAAPSAPTDVPTGILLTHAHIGHYTGLVHLGREAMGADAVPVHVMPRLASFLEANGPWSQLVALRNVALRPLDPATPTELAPELTVEALEVPHRDEFSETVAFVVRGPRRSVLWLPDIDKWERWERPIEEVVASVDVAYVDGTFFADGEIARPMAEIPHPFIAETLERMAPLPDDERAKVRFVHLNHTNPALDPASAAAQRVRGAGFRLAVRGEMVPLGE